jgi:molybdate transport system substrate-binding protein
MTLRFVVIRSILSIFIVIQVFYSCNTSKKESLYIATAANVQFAMDTLAGIFESETGIETHIILGSSGKLTAQILQGAPYDIFVSANMKYPAEIYKNNKASTEPEVYAQGVLVLWTLNESITTELTSLTDDKVRRIAIANPRTAPYGSAALDLLINKGIYENVKHKLVYGESISQVNQFITSKTADIGFTAKSVVISSKMKNVGYWSEMDSNDYSPIEQGVIIINKGISNSEHANKFMSFILSEKAKAILSEFGYITN